MPVRSFLSFEYKTRMVYREGILNNFEKTKYSVRYRSLPGRFKSCTPLVCFQHVTVGARFRWCVTLITSAPPSAHHHVCMFVFIVRQRVQKIIIKQNNKNIYLFKLQNTGVFLTGKYIVYQSIITKNPSL